MTIREEKGKWISRIWKNESLHLFSTIAAILIVGAALIELSFVTSEYNKTKYKFEREYQDIRLRHCQRLGSLEYLRFKAKYDLDFQAQANISLTSNMSR